MLLAIDVGNTNIHLGVYRGETIVGNWRVNTDRNRTGDEHGVLLMGLLAAEGLRPDQIRGCAISNVVPPLTPALRECARRYLQREAEFLGEALDAGIPVRYSPPQAVGADRLADAVAVLRLYGAPAIVVDPGTATTYDAISAAGEYVGGAIAPGLGICLDALYRAAPHLPRIPVARPDRVIGGSTAAGLQSGAYFGFLAQVEGMVRRFRAELGEDARVIATGGFAELFRDAGCFDFIHPSLTLEGLRLIWDRHHPETAAGSGRPEGSTA